MPIMKSKISKPAQPEISSDKPKSLAVAFSTQRHSKKMAKGGEIHPADLMQDEERSSSIADAIRRKRMAKGGMVDLEANSEESPNIADELNMDALGKEQYDLNQLSEQPMDSNESGDDADEGLISQIRRKLRAKSGA